MDIFFKGRGAVVIGAASGIGRAIAAALIETGASVLLCDRNYRARETFESLDIVVNCAGGGAIAAQTRLTGEKERSIQMVRRDEGQVA